jgi:hypothetical protein
MPLPLSLDLCEFSSYGFFSGGFSVFGKLVLIVDWSFCPSIFLTVRSENWLKFCTLSRVKTGSSFVHFQGWKLTQVLYTFKGENWLKFCKLSRVKTGSSFVHFQGWKLTQVLYTFKGENWLKFCKLSRVKTDSSFVHFQGW